VLFLCGGALGLHTILLEDVCWRDFYNTTLLGIDLGFCLLFSIDEVA
jgi:hypothetical protein